MRRRLALAVAALLLVLPIAAPVSAAPATISFDAPSAKSTFGEEISFAQAFSSLVRLARVEVLLDFPESLGPHVVEIAGATAPGDHSFVHSWSAEEGHVYPNTPITARWRLIPADSAIAPAIGPPITLVYADTRFAWRTLSGDVVTLHWYEGSTAFGRRALAIAEKAVREAAEFMGVTESEPIDFFIYADEDAFYDAIGGPGARENSVGAQIPGIRTLFGLIPPGDVASAEVARTIPHELTHLVFETAVDNPYHFPPRWFNEGVATYLSEGYTPYYRRQVEAAGEDGRIMPLQALGGLFPTTYERFALAYAESVSAVDYLVREKGTDALVELINSYGDAVTDDEAFTAAVGTDVAGFEAAWLADLGAELPAQLGPQPAPPGPLPAGWEASAPATAAPGASAPPDPEEPSGDTGSPLRDGWVLLLAALAGVVVGGSVAYVRRRRARGDIGGPTT